MEQRQDLRGERTAPFVLAHDRVLRAVDPAQKVRSKRGFPLGGTNHIAYEARRAVTEQSVGFKCWGGNTLARLRGDIALPKLVATVCALRPRVTSLKNEKNDTNGVWTAR